MSDVSNLSIKKYDPTKCPEHAVIVMIAKRRSGKSFLLRDWLYNHRHRFFAGLVMSGTEEGNHFYEREVGIPRAFIYNDFNETALTRLVERQRKLTRQGKAQPVFIVLDDCGFDKSIFNRKIIRQLLLNGRHWKITLYMCLQYFLDAGPAIRANIDLVVLLKDNMHRDKLQKTFFQMVPTQALFNSIMDSCTDDYKALILDNASTSTNLSDCLFWYKGKDRKPFHIGHKSFYDFSSKRLKTEEDDEDEDAPRPKPKRSGRVKLLK